MMQQDIAAPDLFKDGRRVTSPEIAKAAVCDWYVRRIEKIGVALEPKLQ
jgi:hypothetical protein